MTTTRRLRVAGMLAVLAAVAGGGACQWRSPLKPFVAKSAAKTLALPGSVLTSNPDPEIVRGALSYAMLQGESLLASAPKNDDLLLSTCSQYVLYAVWFAQPEAEAAQAPLTRAATVAGRGKDLCWRAMDAEAKNTSARLTASPDAAAQKFDRDEVPLLYWSAAALTAEISMSGRADLAKEWPAARALAERGLALDSTWNRAALHELMITIDSQSTPGAAGEAAARKHFARAVEVQQGLSPGPYLALAMGVARPKRDRAELEKLLRQAAAIDPEKDPANRLPSTVWRQRAQALLSQIDRLIR